MIEDLPEQPTPNRALPPWAIDELLFGMSKYASATRIWGRLLSIAMSAQARGWTQIQFTNEVTKIERRKDRTGRKRLTEHKLWRQLKACSRDEMHAFQQLDKAWAQGIEHRMNQGFHTAQDLIASAVEAAWAWDERLNEGEDALLDIEALVMSYVIASIEKRQMSRVTCPAREVAVYARISKSTAYRTLKSLTEKGFLVQFSRGSSSKTPGSRRAAIYGLGDPLNLRYGGHGAPRSNADAYQHSYEVERDGGEWVHHRGLCIWGQGLGPLMPYGSYRVGT